MVQMLVIATGSNENDLFKELKAKTQFSAVQLRSVLELGDDDLDLFLQCAMYNFDLAG